MGIDSIADVEVHRPICSIEGSNDTFVCSNVVLLKMDLYILNIKVDIHSTAPEMAQEAIH